MSNWHVTIEDLNAGSSFQDVAGVVMTGVGVLNIFKWPDIQGWHAFEGPVIHSTNWDDKFDATGKTVAVIGAGSSGIQIVPSLLSKISTTFGADIVESRNNGKEDNFLHSADEKAALPREAQTSTSMLGNCPRNMKDTLSKKPEIAENLIPEFPPLCKRLTPGPGYLGALADDECHVINTKISHIDTKSIVTEDGTHRPVDAIICATGFDTSLRGCFPIYGRGGVNLQDRRTTLPESYLSICLDGFPNLFQSLGVNFGLGAGNSLILIGAIHEYVCQVLQRLAQDNIQTIEFRRKAVENFTNYCEAFFKRTIFPAKCPSWYKWSPPGTSAEDSQKGRIAMLWPESSIHATTALKTPRWEDLEYTYVDGNNFGWFGNGFSMAEKTGNTEGLSWYCNDTGFLQHDAKGDVKRGNGMEAANGHGIAGDEVQSAPEAAPFTAPGMI